MVAKALEKSIVHENGDINEIGLQFFSKDLPQFFKEGVPPAILSLAGKTPCCTETLNKYFRVENTSLETALTKFDEISWYPGDL